MARPIVFCSDYGLADEFVGVCHGVIARIAPDARIIDLTHGIRAMDVRAGAAELAGSVRFMPDDAVYLAVVDPGVGTSRRGIAVETAAGQLLVGPDNGLLSLAWKELGGAVRSVEITSEDVFAPAAAHLATGAPLESLGPDVEAGSLVTIPMPGPQIADGQIRCGVLGIDRFGNVQLTAREDDLSRARLDDKRELLLETDEAGVVTLTRARTFDDVRSGQAALIVDSAGWLAAAVNGGSLAEALRIRVGDPVVLSPIG